MADEEVAQLRAQLEAKDAEILFLRERLTNLRVLTEELSAVIAEQPGLMSPKRQVPRPPVVSSPSRSPAFSSPASPPPAEVLDSPPAFPGIKLRRGTILNSSAGKLAHVSSSSPPPRPASPAVVVASPPPPEEKKLKKQGSRFGFGKRGK
jgi:hypothetical protein